MSSHSNEYLYYNLFLKCEMNVTQCEIKENK